MPVDTDRMTYFWLVSDERKKELLEDIKGWLKSMDQKKRWTYDHKDLDAIATWFALFANEEKNEKEDNGRGNPTGDDARGV